MRFDAKAFLESLYSPTVTVQLAEREPVPTVAELASASGPVPDAGTWARRASALLATVADPTRRADLRQLFEERAAIVEFDGNLSRDDAERIAFEGLRDAMQKAGEWA